MSRWFWFLLTITLALPLSTLAESDPKPVNIFVSLLPQQTFVERIGGDRVRVHAMVAPGHSPATYEPTPRQMAQLEQADIYFSIGVPFEKSWLPKIKSRYPDMSVVDTTRDLTLRTMEVHAHSDEHSHEGTGSQAPHSHAMNKDPHVWMSPGNVKSMARIICDELSRMRPEKQSLFKEYLDSFIENLDQVDQKIRNMLAPYQGKRFMVFHPAWGYFAEEYGLKQIPIEVEGKEPGPKTLARLIEKARREKIQVIFVQKQFSSRAAETIAKAIDGEVVTQDPLSADYLDNLVDMAESLVRAWE
jgi:zinc transport system substrate-binding protein